MKQTIYKQLIQAKLKTSHHESDLYTPVVPESTKIINNYDKDRLSVETFISEIDNQEWYNIPFAYDPFWEKYSII